MDAFTRKSTDQAAHKSTYSFTKELRPVQKTAHPEHKFVEMIMKQQIKIAREKQKEEHKDEQATAVVRTPPEVQENGFIQNNVNFIATVSDQDNGSWNEAWSADVDYDPYDDQEIEEIAEDTGPITIYNINGEIIAQEQPEIEAIQTVVEEPEPDAVSDTTKQFVINIGQTKYEVIKKAAVKQLNWKCRKFDEDHDGAIRKGQHNQKTSAVYDLTWHDLSVTPNFFQKLLPYQKVNMYPGISCITKKHHLARHLMGMYKVFPKEYDFFPKTWLLPSQFTDLRNHWAHNNQNKKNKVTYIVKPDSLCQGKGIFLTRSVDMIGEVTMNNNKPNPNLEEPVKVGYIVQQYIDKPHLIDDLKYDLRLYVFLYGVSPLRIYLHQMAFARFCTESYEPPRQKNLDNIYMHLTNYALNKDSQNYQAGDSDGDQGHKRSLGAILQILRQEGCNVDQFMDRVKDLIVKTVITAQPQLSHIYRICQPDCLDNSMAFQILGFDILIDRTYKPLLLEVNCSPSFATDSPLDYKIKKAVICDAFKLLNFSQRRRAKCEREIKEKQDLRQRTGKTVKLSPAERERLRIEKLAERYKFESTRMAGYELVFPTGDKAKNQRYETLLKKANELWDDYNIGKQKNKNRMMNELIKARVVQMYQQRCQPAVPLPLPYKPNTEMPLPYKPQTESPLVNHRKGSFSLQKVDNRKIADTPDLSSRRVPISEVNIQLTTPVKLNFHRESAGSIISNLKPDDSPINQGFSSWIEQRIPSPKRSFFQNQILSVKKKQTEERRTSEQTPSQEFPESNQFIKRQKQRQLQIGHQQSRVPYNARLPGLVKPVPSGAFMHIVLQKPQKQAENRVIESKEMRTVSTNFKLFEYPSQQLSVEDRNPKAKHFPQAPARASTQLHNESLSQSLALQLIKIRPPQTLQYQSAPLPQNIMSKKERYPHIKDSYYS